MNNKDDERLRKTTIAFLKDFAEQGYENAVECIDWLEKQGEKTNPYSGISFEYNGHIWGMCARDNGVDILLDKQFFKHLENQGEQEPTDKIEPKFHEGDWIISNDKKSTYQVIEVKRGIYVIRDNADNHEYHIGIEECEKSGRLWNIADAKEGDVVFYRGNVKYSDGIKYERICLFNNLNNAFFTLTKTSNYVEEYDIDVNIDYLDNTVPATKGQRDLLYVTMKEAGYEWSSEDRKLNKVEPKFKVGDWIIFYGLVTHIDEVVNGRYRTTPIDGIPCSYDWDIDNVVRLWNIADAKDGDVLASDNGVIILVKESRDSSWGYRLSYHCAVLYDGTFEHREFHVNPEKFFPATKEQRDQLEKAMVNARYKWNKKKRKLEKI